MPETEQPDEILPEDSDIGEGESTIILCNCLKDPFADLPPELRPTQDSWKNKLRHVKCPACGKMFWTNRKEDVCSDCQTRSQNQPKKDPQA